MIRPIEERDAAGFVALNRALDQETKFMLFEPGERSATEDEQRGRISQLQASKTQVVLVAEVDDQIVGFIGATRGGARRNRHSASLVMGVLAAYAGRKIGTELLAELEAWARRSDIHRLELTVVEHNERARALYVKQGFEIEGRKRHSLRIDGRSVDEIAMAKILGGE
jgi:RimJ/RimL family protein N-acetyltransferase